MFQRSTRSRAKSITVLRHFWSPAGLGEPQEAKRPADIRRARTGREAGARDRDMRR